MPHLGTQPPTGFKTTTKQSFSGDNSTTAFTLNRASSTATDLEVFVDNIQQEPTTAYSVSGTTLTFTEAPPTGTNNVYVVNRGGDQNGTLPPQDLGTTDYIFGDDISFNSDSAKLNFGADSEITITHVADTGLNFKHTATGDDKPIILTLQTGETDIAADDVIGAINFQAPDEGTGTDAILVAAGIEAVSEGDFSSSSNATKLSFKTGSSETASEKMSIASTGATTITTSGNEDTLSLVSTDADANSGPQLVFNRNSASPADDDLLGRIKFDGQDDAGNNTTYARIDTQIVDASNGTEDSSLLIHTLTGGSERERVRITQAETVFNEGSTDLDFRVESDGNANALIVDGGLSTVGINTAAVSNRTLKIEGEGNLGAILSLNEETRGGLVEFSAGSGTELYIGSELGILGSGNNNELLIHTGVSALKIDRTGAVTKPAQPAFLANPAAAGASPVQNNISSNDTITFGNEVFDQNNDFASNTFTAPVTGKYQLNLGLFLQSVDADYTELRVKIVTSNRNYDSFQVPSQQISADSNLQYQISSLADMDANDTAFIAVSFNSGAAQMDVNALSFFSGYLVA